MIWIYLLIGLACSISITLTHLSTAQGWRFWISTAAVIVIWPLVAVLAYREMWRVTEELADE